MKPIPEIDSGQVCCYGPAAPAAARQLSGTGGRLPMARVLPRAVLLAAAPAAAGLIEGFGWLRFSKNIDAEVAS